MGAFFNPWRRKFGVLTLAMACLLAGAWLRSLSADDYIILASDEFSSDYLESTQGVLVRKSHHSCGNTYCMWSISYSWVVTPLTVLSGWLLLRKATGVKSENP